MFTLSCSTKKHSSKKARYVAPQASNPLSYRTAALPNIANANSK